MALACDLLAIFDASASGVDSQHQIIELRGLHAKFSNFDLSIH